MSSLAPTYGNKRVPAADGFEAGDLRLALINSPRQRTTSMPHGHLAQVVAVFSEAGISPQKCWSLKNDPDSADHARACDIWSRAEQLALKLTLRYKSRLIWHKPRLTREWDRKEAWENRASKDSPQSALA